MSGFWVLGVSGVVGVTGVSGSSPIVADIPLADKEEPIVSLISFELLKSMFSSKGAERELLVRAMR